MNVLILAWVNLAMIKVVEVLIPGIPAYLIVSGLFLFAFIYTAYMGLIGISIADTFQFFFAMFGCIVLAYFILSIPEVGGISGLKEKLPASYFQFIPDFENPSSKDFSIESFLLFIGIIWWSSWYPGAEPGGGGPRRASPSRLRTYSMKWARSSSSAGERPPCCGPPRLAPPS